MHCFAVWAPDAQRVDIDLHTFDGVNTVAMDRSDSGWWRHDGQVGPGTDYAFHVDGGEATPDPRSPWQPYGVSGPSRVFDCTAHEWQDHGWRGPQDGAGVLGGVVYELHVGTFTPEGTLDAAIGRLDDLVALGVDVVELMPLAAFPGRWGWGYDGVHPYAVHEPYGGPAALQRLVDACHQRGLGVCLDVVYNHLGPSGNYLSRFAPYFTDKHHTPWGQAVNLDDEGSPHVRRWIIDNALRWFRDFHVDALRLDAVHELKDDSPRHVLAQLSDEAAALSDALGRPLALIAESDLNDPKMVEPTSVGGYGMTAQWDDDLHHALHTALTGERQGYYADFGSLGAVAKTLTRVFFHDGTWSSFRGEDWGAPVDPQEHDGRRFVGYLQTHDQVGNRAVGDRIGTLLTPGQRAIGAALVMTSPMTPMLFMGEEFAASTPWQYFTDFDDLELGAAVREGRRREFADHGWDAEDVPDPQDNATRDRSVLNWDERDDGEHSRLLEWHRALISLRRQHKELTDGRLDRIFVDAPDDEGWLLVRRGSLALACNLMDRPATLPLPWPDATVLLTWDEGNTTVGIDGVALGGHGVALLRSP
ncbi:MAG TPA: malto-oligosyltrehalose trehalohydrolase [Actinomycetales bacterium]|jgi:maltooligosyltrehalose trehalohydrolase